MDNDPKEVFNRKLEELRTRYLPSLDHAISIFTNIADRKPQLKKMTSLAQLLRNPGDRLQLDGLHRCEEVLKKIAAKTNHSKDPKRDASSKPNADGNGEERKESKDEKEELRTLASAAQRFRLQRGDNSPDRVESPPISSIVEKYCLAESSPPESPRSPSPSHRVRLSSYQENSRKKYCSAESPPYESPRSPSPTSRGAPLTVHTVGPLSNMASSSSCAVPQPSDLEKSRERLHRLFGRLPLLSPSTPPWLSRSPSQSAAASSSSQSMKPWSCSSPTDTFSSSKVASPIVSPTASSTPLVSSPVKMPLNLDAPPLSEDDIKELMGDSAETVEKKSGSGKPATISKTSNSVVSSSSSEPSRLVSIKSKLKQDILAVHKVGMKLPPTCKKLSSISDKTPPHEQKQEEKSKPSTESSPSTKNTPSSVLSKLSNEELKRLVNENIRQLPSPPPAAKELVAQKQKLADPQLWRHSSSGGPQSSQQGIALRKPVIPHHQPSVSSSSVHISSLSAPAFPGATPHTRPNVLHSQAHLSVNHSNNSPAASFHQYPFNSPSQSSLPGRSPINTFGSSREPSHPRTGIMPRMSGTGKPEFTCVRRGSGSRYDFPLSVPPSPNIMPPSPNIMPPSPNIMSPSSIMTPSPSINASSSQSSVQHFSGNQRAGVGSTRQLGPHQRFPTTHVQRPGGTFQGPSSYRSGYGQNQEIPDHRRPNQSSYSAAYNKTNTSVVADSRYGPSRQPQGASRDPRLNKDQRYSREQPKSRERERDRLDMRDRYENRFPKYSRSPPRRSPPRRSPPRRKDSEEIVSPLDSLYSGSSTTSQTGKGYGIQPSYRIPKIRRPEPVQIPSSTVVIEDEAEPEEIIEPQSNDSSRDSDTSKDNHESKKKDKTKIKEKAHKHDELKKRDKLSKKSKRHSKEKNEVKNRNDKKKVSEDILIDEENKSEQEDDRITQHSPADSTASSLPAVEPDADSGKTMDAPDSTTVPEKTDPTIEIWKQLGIKNVGEMLAQTKQLQKLFKKYFIGREGNKDKESVEPESSDSDSSDAKNASTSKRKFSRRRIKIIESSSEEEQEEKSAVESEPVANEESEVLENKSSPAQPELDKVEVKDDTVKKVASNKVKRGERELRRLQEDLSKAFIGPEVEAATGYRKCRMIKDLQLVAEEEMRKKNTRRSQKKKPVYEAEESDEQEETTAAPSKNVLRSANSGSLDVPKRTTRSSRKSKLSDIKVSESVELEEPMPKLDAEPAVQNEVPESSSKGTVLAAGTCNKTSRRKKGKQIVESSETEEDHDKSLQSTENEKDDVSGEQKENILADSLPMKQVAKRKVGRKILDNSDTDLDHSNLNDSSLKSDEEKEEEQEEEDQLPSGDKDKAADSNFDVEELCKKRIPRVLLKKANVSHVKLCLSTKDSGQSSDEEKPLLSLLTRSAKPSKARRSMGRPTHIETSVLESSKESHDQTSVSETVTTENKVCDVTEEKVAAQKGDPEKPPDEEKIVNGISDLSSKSTIEVAPSNDASSVVEVSENAMEPSELQSEVTSDAGNLLAAKETQEEPVGETDDLVKTASGVGVPELPDSSKLVQEDASQPESVEHSESEMTGPGADTEMASVADSSDASSVRSTSPRKAASGKLKNRRKKRGIRWQQGIVDRKRPAKSMQDFPKAKNEIVAVASADGTLYQCGMCNFMGKKIVSHYVSTHPFCEIPASKIPSLEAEVAVKEALEDCQKATENKEGANEEESSPVQSTKACRFCDQEVRDLEDQLDHFTSHTGEYRYSCGYCHYRSWRRDTAKYHIQYLHKGKDFNKVIVSDDQPFTKNEFVCGYMCGQCYYVQIEESRTDSHVNLNHGGEAEVIRVKLAKVYVPPSDLTAETGVDLTASAASSAMEPPADSESRKPGLRSADTLSLEPAETPVDVLVPPQDESVEGEAEERKKEQKPSVPGVFQQDIEVPLDTCDAISEFVEQICKVAHIKQSSKLKPEFLQKLNMYLEERSKPEPPEAEESEKEQTEPERANPEKEAGESDSEGLVVDESVSDEESTSEDEESESSSDSSVSEIKFWSDDPPSPVTAEEAPQNALDASESTHESDKGPHKEVCSTIMKLSDRIKIAKEREEKIQQEIAKQKALEPPECPAEELSSTTIVGRSLSLDSEDSLFVKPLPPPPPYTSTNVTVPSASETANGPPPLVSVPRSTVFRCVIKKCQYKTTSSSAFESHMANDHRRCGEGVCSFCKLRMSSVAEAVAHMEKVHLKPSGGGGPAILPPLPPGEPMIIMPQSMNLVPVSIEQQSEEIQLISSVTQMSTDEPTKPRSGILRIRRLSGDRLSSQPPPEYENPAEQENGNVQDQQNEDTNDDGLPFVITDVMSLNPSVIGTSDLAKNLWNIGETRPDSERLRLPVRRFTLHTYVKEKKTQFAYKQIMRRERLVHLYKCMGRTCYYTTDNKKDFSTHVERHMNGQYYEAFNQSRSVDFMVTGKGQQQQQLTLFPDEGTGEDKGKGKSGRGGKASRGKEKMDVKKANPQYFWEQCAYCLEIIDSETKIVSDVSLDDHVFKMHGSCCYQCPYCFFRSRNQCYIFIHQEQHHPLEKLDCLNCPAVCEPFPVDTELEKTLMRPYVCGSCDYKTRGQLDFKKHLESSHVGAFIYNCGLCDSQTFKADKHIAHQKLHMMYRYQCLYCSFGADIREEVVLHLVYRHPDHPGKMLFRGKIAEDVGEYSRVVEVLCTDGTIYPLDSNPSVQDSILQSPLETVVGTSVLTLPNVATSSGQSSDPLSAVNTSVRPGLPLQPPSVMVISKVRTAPNTANYTGDLHQTISPARQKSVEDSDSDGVLVIDDEFGGDQLSVLIEERLSRSGASDGQREASVQETAVGPRASHRTSRGIDGSVQEEPLTIESILHISEGHQANSNADLESEEIDVTTVPEEDSNMSTNSENKENSALDLQSNSPGISQLEGLSGEALYRCCNVGCDYGALGPQELKDHLLLCDLARETACIACPHCARVAKNINGLLDHIGIHGIKRYLCSLCSCRAVSAANVARHLKKAHGVSTICVKPQDPNEHDLKNALFIVSPKDPIRRGLRRLTSSSSLNVDDTPTKKPKAAPKRPRDVYGPENVDSLPKLSIFLRPARCALCSFTNKVRTNMIRHLDLHKRGEAPESTPINPPPCLETNEMMFDKMTNWAGSSHERAAAAKAKNDEPAKEIILLPAYVPENRRFVCGAPGCTYLTVDDTMLKYHLRALHNDLSDYRCPHCGDVASYTLDRISSHLRLHDSRLYRCSYCLYYHYQRHVIERHLKDKHGDQNPVLITVRDPDMPESTSESGRKDFGAVSVPTVTEVIPVKEPVMPWRCGLCTFAGLTCVEVQDHAKLKHEIGSQLRCALCPYRSSARNSYIRHFSARHPGCEVEIINVFYRADEATPKQTLAPPSPSFSLRTSNAPLWSRDRNRVFHIRGILLDDEEQPPAGSSDNEEDKEIEKYGPLGNAASPYFVCPRCHTYRTKIRSDMRDHLYRDLNYKKFVCTYCSMMAAAKNHLQKHTAKVHEGKRESIASVQPDKELEEWVEKVLTFQAAQLKAQPPSSSSSPAKKNNPKTKNFICKVCGNDFVKQRGLKMHIKNAHLHLGRWKCSYCSLTYSSEFMVRLHCRKSHPNETPIVIPNDNTATVPLNREFWLKNFGIENEKVSKDKSPVIVNSPPSKSWKCKDCSLKFSSYIDLRKHEKCHQVPKPFRCGHCDFVATNDVEVKSHNARVHSELKALVFRLPVQSQPAIQPIRINTKSLTTITSPVRSRSPSASPARSSPATPEKVSVGSLSNVFFYKCYYCPFRAPQLGPVRDHWDQKHQRDRKSHLPQLPFRYKEMTADELPCPKRRKKDASPAKGRDLIPASHVRCKYCPTYGSVPFLQTHCKEAHPDKTFEVLRAGKIGHARCRICGKLSINERAVKKHFYNCHPGMKRDYEILDDELDEVSVAEDMSEEDSSSSTSSPTKSVVPDETSYVFVCLWCQDRCETEEKMHDHYLMYHSHLEEKYDKISQQPEVLKPSKTEDELRQQFCSMCDFFSESATVMYDHVRKHLNPYLCGYCDTSYSSAAKVRSHSQQAHPGLFEKVDMFMPNKPKQRAVARKSTTPSFFPPKRAVAVKSTCPVKRKQTFDDYGFSFYRVKRVRYDLSQISAPLQVGDAHMRTTVQAMSQLINLNPIVKVRDLKTESLAL